jgi:beta-glucosidase
MKKTANAATCVIAALFLALTSCSPQRTATDRERDAFLDNLMGRMTLEEKIGQLNLLVAGLDVTGAQRNAAVEEKVRKGMVGGVFNTFTPTAVRKLQTTAIRESRLGIPLLFGYDVIYGHKTIFPIPLALSCTWNPDLIEKSCRISGAEASADGLNWVYSPMVDIARDPRWGRIMESSGEDPYLGSVIARAKVRGYQGNDLRDPSAVMACVKHFALYGAAEAGRDYNTVDMSRRRMYETYLPPYRAAVEAGVGSVMTSFNEVDGIPATGNRWLLTDLLRNEWGFGGMVVTDYTAIKEMTAHGMGDLSKDAELAMNAGVDMDMVDEVYPEYLPRLVASGKIPKSSIDRACRRILEAKYRLGLFSDPYRGCTEERAKSEILTPENRKTARESAVQSLVLLKNSNQILPLRKSGTIALVGPLADDRKTPLGSWHAAGDWRNVVSVLEGMTTMGGSGVKILHAAGTTLPESPLVPSDSGHVQAMISEAVAAAKKADTVVAVLGESAAQSGEAKSRSDIGLPGEQKELLKALVATGKPVVLVLMNGRPLTLEWEDTHCGAILEAWLPGIEAGNAIADILFGDRNPSGKLTVTFPRNVGQIPIYYAHKNTGRPFNAENPSLRFVSRYLDVPNDPLYAFGHGLSYTSFSCSDVNLSKALLSDNETLQASVRVTNTGTRPGEETLQLYISQPAASVARNVMDLRGFQKVLLQPGETKEVTFAVTTEDLKFWNADLKHDWEPGEFLIRIGGSSDAPMKPAVVRWNRTSH